MKYATIATYCFVGFFELNNTFNIFNGGYGGYGGSCYAYAIPYNTCKYCTMFNKHMPMALRSSGPSPGPSGHKLRPNSANYGSSVSASNSDSSENDFNNLNYISQLNEVYIPFPFSTPNVSKYANTSNTTQLSNTTDTISNIDSYIDNLYFRYTLGGIILIIDKFNGYYNLL